jgi:hypothetical protein
MIEVVVGAVLGVALSVGGYILYKKYLQAHISIQ